MADDQNVLVVADIAQENDPDDNLEVEHRDCAWISGLGQANYEFELMRQHVGLTALAQHRIMLRAVLAEIQRLSQGLEEWLEEGPHPQTAAWLRRMLDVLAAEAANYQAQLTNNYWEDNARGHILNRLDDRLQVVFNVGHDLPCLVCGC